MTEAPSTDPKSYRRGWWSWALYDVGNSAFWLVIVAAVFPFYYQELYVAEKTPPGTILEKAATQDLRTQGGSRLAYTAAVAMVIVAVMGPILGAVADRSAAKKRLLAVFAAVGIIATGLMVLIGPGDLLLASILYTAGTIGVAGSMVFYDALLPAVARQDDLDRISSFGFAAGYLGSVLLFVANVVLLKYPDTFGLSGDMAVRLSFFGVAVWWALFTVPLLRNVREPAADDVLGEDGQLVEVHGASDVARRDVEVSEDLSVIWHVRAGVGQQPTQFAVAVLPQPLLGPPL